MTEVSIFQTELEKIDDLAPRGKIKFKPIFYIKYGPPASGKSSLVSKSGLDVNKFYDINVDGIVQKLARGKSLAQAEYFAFRKSADYISDWLMLYCLMRKVNVSWETTGFKMDYFYQFPYQPFIIDAGYDIYLGFPVVELDNLVDRCNRRAQAADCSPEYLSLRKQKALDNFDALAEAAARVFLFDNNGAVMEEINKDCDIHREFEDVEYLKDYIAALARLCTKRNKRH